MFRKATRASGPLFAAGLLFSAVNPAAIPACAQGNSAAPASLAPPAGNAAFLETRGTGTQDYVCLPSAKGQPSTAWTFFGPQATLSISSGRFNQQVATHFLSPVPTNSPAPAPGCALAEGGAQLACPSWQSSFDTSAVWGSKLAAVTAGSDPSCPSAGAVPCLLLKSVATRRAQFGEGGVFAHTSYIQRLNTVGGSAPAGACKAGDSALVPYSATYIFFTKEDTAGPESSR